MPLLSTPAKTPAQKAADQIRAAAQAQIRILEQMQADGIRNLWKDSQATPQQICDQLGADAGQAFTCHGILTMAILQIRQVLGGTPKIMLPTKNFTQNQDGTVTVSDDPYPIPPELQPLFGGG